MNKGKTTSALAMLLVLGLGALTGPAGAQSTEDKLAAAEDRLAQVEQEAQQATARYEEAHSSLIRTREEIEATKQSLESASKRISALEQQLNDRAGEAYRMGTTSTWELLLEAEDFSEFSDRLVYLDRLAQDDADLATRVAVISEELRRHRENMARLQEEQAAAVDKAEREKTVIYRNLDEAQALREQLEGQLAEEREAARQLAEAQAAAASGGGSGSGSIGTVTGSSLQACPAPGTSFSDTFGAPRSGGRSHAGVDMMGGYGTPVYAALPGSVSRSSSSLGGNQAYVHSAGGTYTFYAHLQGFSDASGSVSAGTMIGYIGDTGNATGTPHLHFEYHPNGGLTNPTPHVAAVC